MYITHMYTHRSMRSMWTACSSQTGDMPKAMFTHLRWSQMIG